MRFTSPHFFSFSILEENCSITPLHLSLPSLLVFSESDLIKPLSSAAHLIVGQRFSFIPTFHSPPVFPYPEIRQGTPFSSSPFPAPDQVAWVFSAFGSPCPAASWRYTPLHRWLHRSPVPSRCPPLRYEARVTFRHPTLSRARSSF